VTIAPEPTCPSPKFQLQMTIPASSVDPLPSNVQVSPVQPSVKAAVGGRSVGDPPPNRE
jgi:hypothetical protein